MKKFTVTLMALAILLSLCACGTNPAEPAATTEPLSVTTNPVTNESFPACEINGHNWAEATCTNPKTCSVCNITEGESLAHAWIEANYQAAKTCSVCAATEGSPLTAAFEQHGLVINVTEQDKEYEYVTVCSEENPVQTIGKLKISNYKVFSGDETRPALEGYEWHNVTVTILFDDENAWDYGCSLRTSHENYYDVDGWDASGSYLEDQNMFRYTVNYNGTDYTECLFYDGHEYVWSEWVDGVCTCTFERSVRVPVGFNGAVLSFYNSGIAWGDGQHIYDIADDNTLFFQLDGVDAQR